MNLRPTDAVQVIHATAENLALAAEAPADLDVDLNGVTPIRWDDDEVAGKDDPSKRDENEKIDPVKLDERLESLEETFDAVGLLARRHGRKAEAGGIPGDEKRPDPEGQRQQAHALESRHEQLRRQPALGRDDLAQVGC